MRHAILILERAYNDSMIMQSSPESNAYSNSLKLAIEVLKRYDSILSKKVEQELAQFNP